MALRRLQTAIQSMVRRPDCEDDVMKEDDVMILTTVEVEENSDWSYVPETGQLVRKAQKPVRPFNIDACSIEPLQGRKLFEQWSTLSDANAANISSLTIDFDQQPNSSIQFIRKELNFVETRADKTVTFADNSLFLANQGQGSPFF